MKALKIVCLVFSLMFLGTFLQDAKAMLMEKVVVTGKVHRVTDSHVDVKDRLGQIYHVSFNMLGKKKSYRIGEVVSFTMKLNLKREQATFELNSKVKLTKEDRKQLHAATVKFMSMVHERMAKEEKDYRPVEWDYKQSSYFNHIINFFLSEAYSTGAADCIFAGWPSTKMDGENGACRVPWSSNSQSVSHYNGCGGGDNVIRCNPKLFGKGFTGSSGNFSNTSAVQPYPGASVKVFKTSSDSAAHGICVNVGPTDNVMYNCLQAAQRNMPSILQNFNAANFNAEFAPLINSYCGTNVCLPGTYKNGNACVAACPSGTTANGHECQAAAAPGDTTAAPPVAASAPLAGSRSAECRYIAQQVASINFHRAPETTRCAVYESTESTVATCKNTRMMCQRGGQMFQGYLSASQYTSLQGTNPETGARVNVSAMTVSPGGTVLNADRSLVFNFNADMHLYREPCKPESGAGSSPRVDLADFSGCQVAAPASLSLGESFTGSNTYSATTANKCTGDYCVLNGTCLSSPPPAPVAEGAPATSAVNPYFVDVTVVCSCTKANNFRTCQLNQIPQFTPIGSNQELYFGGNGEDRGTITR